MKQNNSILTRVLTLVLCTLMCAGVLTACFQMPEFNPVLGTPNGVPTPDTTTGSVVEKDPTEDPVDPIDPEPEDPNLIFSASTTIAEDSLILGTLTNDVVIGGEGATALVPADVMVDTGASSLQLSIKNVEGETLADSISNLDVHISGIAANNTVPMTVMLGAILPIGLGNTELKFYHIENGTPVLMTRVNSASDFAIHNQYVYDAETGNVTIYVASFSVFTAVQSVADVWDGEAVADGFESGEGTEEAPYIINSAAQLVYFRNQVDAGVTYAGQFVKLNKDIDLDGKLFDPIGFGYTYNKDSDTAFMGTFDGGNHTIYNLYQNGWDLDPDKVNYSTYTYSTAGGGLFASIENATIKNLVMSGADIVFECVDIGIVVGYAQGNCHFENIVVTNSTIANYNRATGAVVGEVCYGSYGTDVSLGYSHTFNNITVDSSVVVSSLWGSFDTLCGGVIGGKWGDATVKMENVIVAAELDVYSDVTAAYQWYAYRRCGMLIGHTEQNSPRKALNAAAEFLTCVNVDVYYGDWVNYNYYEFANQDSGTGQRYPWVRAEAGLNNGAFSNPRYGVPTHTVDGVTTKVTELTPEQLNAVKTDYTPIVFNQLYGGGQGVYGTNEHANNGGVTIHNSLKKTIYIENDLGWENLKLHYWFANGTDRWTTLIDGINMTKVSGNIYMIEVPAYADGFKIVGDRRNVTTFSTPEISLSAVAAKTVYPLTAFNLTLNIDGANAFNVLTGNWLYNTQVNTSNVPKAEDYDVIIYDKSYTGTFTTNAHGAAIVLDSNGKLIKIYDGANGGYWIEGSTSADTTHGVTSSNFATLAWSELQDGEMLIIFPNDGGTNVSRAWALALRPVNGAVGSIGQILTLTTTVNTSVHICSDVCTTCFGCRNKECAHADCQNNRCDCLDIYVDVNINGVDNTLVVTGNNWLYNTEVNRNNYPYASHYQVIIYDKSYEGTFTTNEFGIAVVLDADNKIVKIYDAANGDRSVVYYDANGSEVIVEAGEGNANGTYATLAWSELEEGEKLAIFPNHKSDNSARNWAKELCNNWANGLNGATAIITAILKLPTTIYFQNTQDWTNVGIQYWYEDGTTLTGVLGETTLYDGLHDVYRVVLPANVVQVAFGSADSAEDDATVTISTPEITSLQNGYIYVVNGQTVNSALYKSGYKTVKFSNEWGWNSIKIYYWFANGDATWTTFTWDNRPTMTSNTYNIPAYAAGYVISGQYGTYTFQTNDNELSDLNTVTYYPNQLVIIKNGDNYLSGDNKQVIFFRNDWNWSSVNLHHWLSTSDSTTWPGEAMIKVGTAYVNGDNGIKGNRDVYMLVFTSSHKYLIFNGYNPNEGASQQTNDIYENVHNGAFFTIVWNNGNYGQFIR